MNVQEIKDELIEVMRVLGVYSPAFDTLITSCAQLSAMRDKAYNKAIRSTTVIKESSREGDNRVKVNPAYTIYIEIGKELRATLGDLTLTVKASTFANGDALDELNAKLREVLDATARKRGASTVKN